MLLEHSHQPGKIEQRTAQPVYLVDDHRIDPLGFDFFEQLSKRRAIHVAPAEAAVIIFIGQRLPALLALAQNEPAPNRQGVH